MLEMSSDRLNRLPAGGAKESEVSVGNVQMERYEQEPSAHRQHER